VPQNVIYWKEETENLSHFTQLLEMMVLTEEGIQRLKQNFHHRNLVKTLTPSD
jgi:hypothetical protein